jgi:repressor LexA
MTSTGLRSGQDLTPVQREICRFIEDYGQRVGYPPSYREIAQAAGLSSLSSVSHHLRALQGKGYLSHQPGRPRTAVRCPGGPAGGTAPGGPPPGGLPAAGPGRADRPDTVHVTLAGRIAAGNPVLSGQPTMPGASMVSGELGDDGYALPRQLLGEGTFFMLRVAGDSMTGAGITDGDLVVIRQQPDAENGDIVAAMIDGLEVEGTVKTLKRSPDGHIWLMPHNPAYTPILGDDAVIAGKVVLVLRRV